MLEGHRYREQQDMEKLAWAAAILIQPWASKPITADDLLGRKRKVSQRKIEQMEKQKERAKRIKNKLENSEIARTETAKLSDLHKFGL